MAYLQLKDRHSLDARVQMRQLVRVVDDDVSLRESLSVLLETVGYNVEVFATAEDCLAAVSDPPACLVVDLELPGMDGAALADALQRRGDRSPVVLITGTVRSDLLERASRSRAAFVLRKPFDPEALIDAIEQALSHSL